MTTVSNRTVLSTNNWDTAFGIKFKDANAAIVAQSKLKGSTLPKEFSDNYEGLGIINTVSAKFEPWQMSGGSGSLLQMKLPLEEGTISNNNESSTFEGEAIIQVSLGFIPQPGQQLTKQLKINLGQGVSVLQINLTSGPDSAKVSILGALQNWLSNNLDQFNHVFAAVDLNDKADTGDFDWLKPTHVGYAIYTEGFDSVDDYLFGVLAMTNHSVGVNLSPVLDPNIIPKDADAGFLISAPLVIQQLFKPHVKTLFNNAATDEFDTLNDGMTLYNIKPLSFSKLVLEDGTEISDAKINVDGFNLSIGSGALVLEFVGMTFLWEEDYTVKLNYRSVNEISTDKEGHLQLKSTGTPTLEFSVSKSSSKKFKELWEGILTSIALAVIGAVIGGALQAHLAARAAKSAAEVAQNTSKSTGPFIETEMVPIKINELDGSLIAEEEIPERINQLEDAVKSLKNPEAPQRFNGFFKVGNYKMLGAVLGGLIGSSLGGLALILKTYTIQDSSEIPTLDGFATKAIGNTDWASSSGYGLKSAKLVGSLQLGLMKKG
jgi:hypothetical protein